MHPGRAGRGQPGVGVGGIVLHFRAGPLGPWSRVAAAPLVVFLKISRVVFPNHTLHPVATSFATSSTELDCIDLVRWCSSKVSCSVIELSPPYIQLGMNRRVGASGSPP